MTATPLGQAAEEYIAVRRSFGYKLRYHDRLLADFCSWLERAGAHTVSTDAAVSWAVAPRASDSWHAERLSAVRGFATYLHVFDPCCEVPPRDLLPAGHRRVPPHIYSPQEIDALTTQARLLSPPLRAATFDTLIGLLAVTGMRPGEALRLNRADVDLETGTIKVVATKFNKDRQLALHATTTAALASYAELRERCWPQPATTSFFVSNTGRRLSHSSLLATFSRLLDRGGLGPPAGSRGRHPRPMDIRHTFAVATLLDAYRKDQDVQALLPSLSSWLGHSRPSATYWYLSAVPELLAEASQRTQRRRAR